ncbi:MAG: phosphatidate cytidylyltransferase [Planctomycetaceae bacterium]|nr:phosphatidate cytidylyltransferase [Planctomycetaceae bacterium]MCA9063949.1 phosphatidate cytidylyltransferase [Planctomycetaceae bacterium]
MDELALQFGVTKSVLVILISVFAALVLGTAVRLTMLRHSDPEKRKTRIGSLIAWWVMAAIMAIAVLLGQYAGILLFAVLSVMGLREFLRITGQRFHEQPLELIAFCALPCHYAWILLGWQEAFWMFIPACVFLLLPVRLILAGQMEGFIPAAAAATWGMILIVYCFSHAAMLLTLDPAINPAGGRAGWFLFLLILTEMNDIAQALWGRRFGRHKVVPRVSPNKSWEGLILGMLTTVALAWILAPLLTSLADVPTKASELGAARPSVMPVAAGVLISIGGFFGDLNMSAVKRDLGIKDAGHLIPGQGGILDRIDSLTYTAPLFYYFVYFTSR